MIPFLPVYQRYLSVSQSGRFTLQKALMTVADKFYTEYGLN
jgi:hypothetical protein